MKKLISILFFLAAHCINAQNLVPNYSFEQFSSCPNSDNQVSYATGWKSYCSTPDYYNACDSLYSLGVPSNIVGFQNASTGNAYCGFFCYLYKWNGNIGLREHIGTQLTSSLVVGTKYCVSANISFNYKSGTSNCANNNIGIKFSSISYENYGTSGTVSSSPAVNNFAHIYSSLIVTDTANWTTISGSFVADSAYNYVMVGNFFDNNNTDTLILNSNDSLCYSYYYVDDIIVYECDCDTTPPVAKFNYTSNSLTVNFSDLSTAGVNYWQWYFDDGTTDTVQNPVHTYDSAGNYTVTLVACNDFCCDTFEAQVSVSVGLHEIGNNNFISSIYPNPNDGIMRMDYELKEGQRGELLIYDLTGRIVKQFILNTENNSLTINLTVGIYFYTMNLNGEKILSDKLIIIN